MYLSRSKGQGSPINDGRRKGSSIPFNHRASKHHFRHDVLNFTLHKPGILELVSEP
ncbi:hypothetical protein M413DRAFT_445814, partial [Hebeloma cylindrosporum]